MALSRNEIVASCFAAHARDYDGHARLQADVADSLATMLPALERPKVLEVGCGTGFLTRHLLEAYPKGDFLITDLAPEMVTRCRANYEHVNGRALRFAVMDGEAPDCDESFDLIVLSMTLQWFSKPLEGLRRLTGMLNPNGTLLYATVGKDSFSEWRKALDVCDLRHGLIRMPGLPHVCREEIHVVDYGSGLGFLKTLKAIGASTPRPAYEPLPAGKLRAALRWLEAKYGAQVTWRIIYGMISA
jgi:malonyl-CoA O-methyltransferase